MDTATSPAEPEYQVQTYQRPVWVRLGEDGVPQCPHCHDPMVRVDGGWICALYAAIGDELARLMAANPPPTMRAVALGVVDGLL